MNTTTRMKELPPGKVSYSPMERTLFKFLSSGKRLNSTELIQKFYKDTISEHFHARETVNAALTSLRRKLEFNKAPIQLKRSQLSGPRPVEWWVE